MFPTLFAQIRDFFLDIYSN